MFVWHNLVTSQIYSWPLVTGTDLPPCWPLKEPIPNDLGKRQPLAVIFLAILLGHLLSAAWRSGKCHRLKMELKETPCAGDFGGKTWSCECSYYRRYWIFTNTGSGEFIIQNYNRGPGFDRVSWILSHLRTRLKWKLISFTYFHLYIFSVLIGKTLMIQTLLSGVHKLCDPKHISKLRHICEQKTNTYVGRWNRVYLKEV